MASSSFSFWHAHFLLSSVRDWILRCVVFTMLPIVVHETVTAIRAGQVSPQNLWMIGAGAAFTAGFWLFLWVRFRQGRLTAPRPFD